MTAEVIAVDFDPVLVFVIQGLTTDPIDFDECV
jgi:hypothetical protein